MVAVPTSLKNWTATTLSMQNVLLTAGVGAMASVLGYLVGASSSPAVGLAVTAGFGLLTAGLGYAQATATKKPEDDPAKASSAALIASLVALVAQLSPAATLPAPGPSNTVPAPAPAPTAQIAQPVTLAMLGWMLLVFAALVIFGLQLGIHARTAHEMQEVNVPWKGKKPPADLANAVQWIELARRLRLEGISEGEIEQLYARSNGVVVAVAPAPPAAAASASAASSSPSPSLATPEWFKLLPQGAASTPYLAEQPPPTDGARNIMNKPFTPA